MPGSGTRRLALAAMAVLLIPTAYAMLKGHFLLAGVCVCGIVVARFLIVPGDDNHEQN